MREEEAGGAWCDHIKATLLLGPSGWIVIKSVDGINCVPSSPRKLRQISCRNLITHVIRFLEPHQQIMLYGLCHINDYPALLKRVDASTQSSDDSHRRFHVHLVCNIHVINELLLDSTT